MDHVGALAAKDDDWKLPLAFDVGFTSHFPSTLRPDTRWSCSLMIVDRLSRPLGPGSPERAPLVFRVRFVGEVLLFLGLANHSAQITIQIIFIDLVIVGVISVQIVQAARLEQG